MRYRVNKRKINIDSLDLYLLFLKIDLTCSPPPSQHHPTALLNVSGRHGWRDSKHQSETRPHEPISTKYSVHLIQIYGLVAKPFKLPHPHVMFFLPRCPVWDDSSRIKAHLTLNFGVSKTNCKQHLIWGRSGHSALLQKWQSNSGFTAQGFQILSSPNPGR